MDREPSTVSPLMGTSADSLSTVDMRHGTLDARKGKGDKLTIIERSTDGSENSTSSRSGKWSHYIWWLETLCAILAIGAFIGIVATVKAFDGSPLPEWPYRVSINAFIASYSVILKTCVGLILAEGISHIKWTNLKRPGSLRSFWVHDEASRGPWGAVHLLFNDKGRHISSLGAIITVLILFLEPFSQQIVSFPDCDLINNTVVATIPRTNLYEFEGKTFGGGASATIPWGVRNSVNQGMFATNKPQLEVSCDSGNCTFPGTYNSLAFCGVCNDMTDSLTRENRYANISNLTDVPVFARYPNVTLSNPEDKSSNLTLQIVTPAGNIEEEMCSLVGRGYPAIEVIRALDPETYVAYSCKISPCVRSYEGEVKNGRFLETQKSEHMIPRNLMYQAFRVADLDCLRESQKDQLREMGYDLEANPRWLPYNVTVGFNKTSGITYRGFCEYMPEDKIDKYCNKTTTAIGNQRYPLTDEAAKIVPAECVYSMSDVAGTSLNSNLFKELFKGNISEWGEFWSGAGAIGPEPLMAIWYAGSGNGTLEDMSALMRNISETLTTHVRHNGNGNFSQPFTGEVHYNSTCISVRWEWITYSGAIVAFTLIFFIWVVVQAKVDQAQLRKAWESHDTHAPFYDFKSSALTLLFHGLDDNSRRDLVDVGSTNRTSEMAKRSKNIDIQLVATERGWKLAAVGPQA